MRSRRIGLVAQGSRGDIQPFVALGRALADRGAEVELAAPENFASFVTGAGLRFLPMPGDTRALMESARGRRVLARGDVLTWGLEMWAFVRPLWDAHADIIATLAARSDAMMVHPLSFPATLATVDPARVPWGVALTFPFGGGARAYASPLLLARALPSRRANALSHRASELLFWAPYAQLVARRRARAGLPPLDADGFTIARSEQLLVLRAWDDALVPGDASHVPRPTGDWALDASPDAPLDPAIDAWIDAGPPPIYAGFGSLPILDPRASLRAIERASADVGARVLVAAGWSAAGWSADVGSDAAHVRVVSSLDHARVLPRCIAAIHHGGAGTTHATLRAGLPALVTSVYADQPFWGARVEALGAGTTIPFRRLDAGALARGLARVLEPRARDRARAIASRMTSDGAARAAGLVLARL